MTVSERKTGDEQAAEEARRTAGRERERLQQEILARLVVSFTASHVHQPDSPWFEQRVAVMVEESRLFMRYLIPSWPPRLLLRKLVRWLIAPVFAPQVEFNEAVRDVVLELRQRADSRVSDFEETSQIVTDLQGQVALLTAQVEALSRALETARRPASAAPSAPSAGGAAFSPDSLAAAEARHGNGAAAPRESVVSVAAGAAAAEGPGNEGRP